MVSILKYKTFKVGVCDSLQGVSSKSHTVCGEDPLPQGESMFWRQSSVFIFGWQHLKREKAVRTYSNLA